MRSRLLLYACALYGAACTGGAAPQPEQTPVADPVGASKPTEPPASAAAPEPTSAPAAAQHYTETNAVAAEDGSERFGPPLSQEPPVQLTSLLGTPSEFAGKVLKVEGTVRRVCKNQGCWVELEGQGDASLRVPMAGHALSIPQRAIGRKATVEGAVEVRELSAAQKAHYASEGMTATEHAVSILATSVLVAP